MILIICYK